MIIINISVIFCPLVYSIASDISLAFSPIYLSLTKPVRQGFICLEVTGSRRLAILKSADSVSHLILYELEECAMNLILNLYTL